MSSRLIVADENIPQVRECFAPLGTVVTLPGRTLAPAAVAAADILLVRSVTPVDARLLDGSRVGFVGTATIGTDHLDLAYLRDAGIAVASAPASNAQSVVDYVLSALATLDGVLERVCGGSVGCSVGIVGLGNVGSRLLRRLLQMGINAVGYDPFVSAADLPQRPLAQVLKCDVVCLHTPLTREGEHPTWHLLDATRLSTLKPGAVLLNAGRGAVIDNAALLQLLEQRPDLQVVLDVWESEPAISIPLLAHVTLGTPHIAGYSLDGKLAGTQMLLRACCEFLGEPVPPQQAGGALQQLALPEAGGSAVDVLRAALLAVYDPRRDDLALRAERGADAPEMADHFDRLRKHYPVRREIAGFVIQGAGLNPAARTLLTAAGFKVAD